MIGSSGQPANHRAARSTADDELYASSRRSRIVVDLPAVVRVDERVVPELVALIDVGRSGRGEVQNERAKCVRAPSGATRDTNRATSARNGASSRGLEHEPRRSSASRRSYSRVRLDPARARLGFARRLDHVLRERAFARANLLQATIGKVVGSRAARGRGPSATSV